MKANPSENQTKIGTNRTGIDASPFDGQALIDGQKLYEPSRAGDVMTLTEIREVYLETPLAVGKVPPPGTPKGVASTVAQIAAGNRPEVLIDKLGQRLAFERTGTRLYDALLCKLEASGFTSPVATIERLREYRDQEARHMFWVAEAMRSIGADPTAQTPCADVDGVASSGLLQVIADPRTTPSQCFGALLIAELADNDGWELLIELTAALGHDAMAERFRTALEEEAEHLRTVRDILQDLVLVDASARPEAGAA